MHSWTMWKNQTVSKKPNTRCNLFVTYLHDFADEEPTAPKYSDARLCYLFFLADNLLFHQMIDRPKAYLLGMYGGLTSILPVLKVSAYTFDFAKDVALTTGVNDIH